MKELIKTIEHNGNPSVLARDLHHFLEVGKVFGAWINDRIEQYGFIANEDFEVFLNFEKNSKGGRPTKEYILSMDMAKELAMIERSKKGKQARHYFIECEKRLKQTSQRYLSPIHPSTDVGYVEVNITEHRKQYHKNFIKEAKSFLYSGDLKKIAQENNIPYSRVQRVMNCVIFDYNIINHIYQKAMDNKYFLEVGMNQMIRDLRD